MGEKNLKLHLNDSLTFNNKTYKGTPGLYELIFALVPPQETNAQDRTIYKVLLTDAQTHLKKNGVIKSNTGQKYIKIIRPLFLPNAPKRGGSLMELNNKRVQYIYFDSINELIERLELLVREFQAGNRAHRNEILSIIDELVEQKVIKKLCKGKFSLV